MTKWIGERIQSGLGDTRVESLQESVACLAGDAAVDDRLFSSSPTSICGNVVRKSDKLEPGARIPIQKCLCRNPAVVGIDKSGRAFLTCEGRKCKYFRWADAVVDPPYYNLAHSKVVWKSLSPPVYKLLPSVDPLAEHIIQGSLGDCWFLSALSVLCSNQERLFQVIGDDSSPDSVCFRFCASGIWETVQIGREVPHFVLGPKSGMQAFAKAKSNISFGPLVEKAYAKLYGSYAALSGGFVAEALFDLTGCPTDSVDLTSEVDKDLLWAKLQSWQASGFLLGCATSTSIPSDEGEGGQGLATLHAYSVTDTIELFDVPVGKQTKITDFLANCKAVVAERIPRLRLVQIRNPWGRREWTGDWSGKSEKWTRSVIEKLPSYAERDMKGKFWMEFDDFVTAFSEVDVAKTHTDWFSLALRVPAVTASPLRSLLSGSNASKRIFLSVSSGEQNQCWTYIMIVHPSSRRDKSRCYPDCHVLLVETESSKIYASLIGQVERVMTLETMLKPNTQYELVLFTVLETLTASNDWEPVVRVLSASPLELNLTKESRIHAGIQAAQFEEALVDSLALEQSILVTPAISLSVHSSSSMAAFVLSYTGEDECDIEVVVNLRSRNLACTGRWKHTVCADEPGRVVLGVIAQKRTQYRSSSMRLSGYEFEIDVGPSSGKKQRINPPTEAASKIIELD